MTEPLLLAQRMAERLSVTRQYGDAPLTPVEREDKVFLVLPMEDADVLVFFDGGEKVRAVLSYLLPHESEGEARHLNYCGRAWEGDNLDAACDVVWGKFWADEVENRALGRLQWMHGPGPLPDTARPVEAARSRRPDPPMLVDLADVLELLGD